MHGMTEFEEIDYWRKRAEKAERDRDEARKLAADAARELVELKREAELWRENEVARLDAEDGQ